MSANLELRNFGGTASYMLRPNIGRGIFVVRVIQKGEVLMDLIEILSLVIIAVGFAISYLAKAIVKRFGLKEKQECVNAAEMTEEEIDEYKQNKAVYRMKLTGLAISIPGLIIFILAFR